MIGWKTAINKRCSMILFNCTAIPPVSAGGVSTGQISCMVGTKPSTKFPEDKQGVIAVWMTAFDRNFALPGEPPENPKLVLCIELPPALFDYAGDVKPVL